MSEAYSCLVTGANGFIGTRLVRLLVQRHGAQAVTVMAGPATTSGHPNETAHLREMGVRVLEADLLDSLPSCPEWSRLNAVFHLAAHAATEDVNGRFEVNDLGTRKLIEWLGPNLQGARFIYTGTLASMDRDESRGPATEASHFKPKTPYGQTKFDGEQLVKSKAAELGFSYSIVRLCTVIGPGFRPGGMFHIFPEMLAKHTLATRLNWPGKASYLHVEDAAALLAQVAGSAACENQTFLAANGESLSFSDLLDEMAIRLGHSRACIALPSWLWRAAFGASTTGATLRLIPAQARIFCWRISKLCSDGLWVDPSKLHGAIPMKYRLMSEALDELYGTPKR